MIRLWKPLPQPDSLASVYRSVRQTDLVDEILKIGTAHSWTSSSDNTSVNGGIDLDIRHMVLQNLNPSPDIRQSDDD
jgi:hypothetical protein